MDRLRLCGQVRLLVGLAWCLLFLGWNGPDKRPPGRREHAGAATGRYCPKCGRLLKQTGGNLWCSLHGEIDDNEALNSPPNSGRDP